MDPVTRQPGYYVEDRFPRQPFGLYRPSRDTSMLPRLVKPEVGITLLLLLLLWLLLLLSLLLLLILLSLLLVVVVVVVAVVVVKVVVAAAVVSSHNCHHDHLHHCYHTYACICVCMYVCVWRKMRRNDCIRISFISSTRENLQGSKHLCISIL